MDKFESKKGFGLGGRTGMGWRFEEEEEEEEEDGDDDSTFDHFKF